jgi:hypothetical protein
MVAGSGQVPLDTDLDDLETVRLVRDEFISPNNPLPVRWCKSAAWSTQLSGSKSTR